MVFTPTVRVTSKGTPSAVPENVGPETVDPVAMKTWWPTMTSYAVGEGCPEGRVACQGNVVTAYCWAFKLRPRLWMLPLHTQAPLPQTSTGTVNGLSTRDLTNCGVWGPVVPSKTVTLAVVGGTRGFELAGPNDVPTDIKTL